MDKIIVIGSGFSGLAAACCLAQQGFEVEVLEKNTTAGGRARQFQQCGYTFDMGPSWYWMPDVFEHFFKRFDQSIADYYHLVRLDPSYQMYFEDGTELAVPADYHEFKQLFESIETGSGIRLDRFLEQAQVKYELGMHNFVFKPGNSALEFVSLKTLKGAYKLNLLHSFHKHVRKYFHHPKLLQLLTFPILFLGATAKDTPALYSLMNFADIKLGTWYPMGGMYEIIKAMVNLAQSLGVKFHYEQEVSSITVKSGRATEVVTSKRNWHADVVVASADYHHIETTCLPAQYQSYSSSYWDSRTMAPSSLIYYVGVSKKLPGLLHHNLFFDEDLNQHSKEIYTTPKWPSKPLFYVSATSKTDPSVCPPGHENLFILVPVAPGLDDTLEVRDHYYNKVMDRMENKLGTELRSLRRL